MVAISILSVCVLLSLFSSSRGNAEEQLTALKCDESLCRNPMGYWPGGYHCWATLGAGATEGYACAGEYEGRPVPSLPPVEYQGGSQQYYTCCPKKYDGPFVQDCTNTSCSSPDGQGGTDCWANEPLKPMTCAFEAGFNYPRKTGAIFQEIRWYSQYICCQSNDGTPQLRPSFIIAEGFRLALACLAISGSLVLLFAILSSPRARSQAVNLYLVYLLIPDVVINGLSITMGAQNIHGAQKSCPAVNFIIYFFSTANMWLNAAVARNLYILLRNSHKGRRTNPPSLLSVSKQAAAVYLFASAMGTWGAVLVCGYVYVMSPTDERLRILILALGWVIMMLPPFAYFIYVCFRVWRDKLLPKTGRTRVLSLYFLRIILVFVVFWIPGAILINIAGISNATKMTYYIPWYLGSIQTMMSLAMVVQKPDVKSAIIHFLKCHCRDKEGTGFENESWWSVCRDRLSALNSVRRLRNMLASEKIPAGSREGRRNKNKDHASPAKRNDEGGEGPGIHASDENGRMPLAVLELAELRVEDQLKNDANLSSVWSEEDEWVESAENTAGAESVNRKKVCAKQGN